MGVFLYSLTLFSHIEKSISSDPPPMSASLKTAVLVAIFAIATISQALAIPINDAPSEGTQEYSEVVTMLSEGKFEAAGRAFELIVKDIVSL